MVLCNLITPPDSRVTFHKTSILLLKIVGVSGDFISIYKMSLDVSMRAVLYCDKCFICDRCCGTDPPPSILYPKQTSLLCLWEISIAPRQLFHQRVPCALWDSLFKSWCGIMAELITSIQHWTRPKWKIPDWLQVIQSFCPALVSS